MELPEPVPTDPDARSRLLHAACDVFGTYNLEGATTRGLAEVAGVNQAAIPYYFDGKEGLYLATIQHLFATKMVRVRPLIDEIQSQCSSLSPREALTLLKKLLTTMLEMFLEDDASKSWARIIMREQMQPTKAFDILYQGAIDHVHQAVSSLVGIILSREPTHRIVILRAHMLVGQVLIFLSGRETIRRRLGLVGYTESEIAEIREALYEQLDLLLTRSGDAS